MAENRLDTLKNMVAQRPNDSFLRYGLAMEYRNTGDLDSAIAEFRALLAADPGYIAGYYHGGQTLATLGRLDEAREMYRRGIEVASAKGDRKTGDELRTALEMLG